MPFEHCPDCGASLERTDIVCDECGSPLYWENISWSDSTPSTLRYFLVMVGVLVLVLILLALYLWLVSPSIGF